MREEYWLFVMLFIVSKFHFCNLKIKKTLKKTFRDLRL